MTPEEKKEKARWTRIFRTYGITQEQYRELDNGECPVCLRGWSDTIKPCVDHDHKTGEVRGLLCLYCNHRMVGRHRDANLVQRIADYLKRPVKGWVIPPKKKRKKNARRPRRKD